MTMINITKEVKEHEYKCPGFVSRLMSRLKTTPEPFPLMLMVSMVKERDLGHRMVMKFDVRC